MAVRQYQGRGGRVLEENVEGVHTLRPGGRYYAVLLNRPGRGLGPHQALATAAAANGVVRAAKLPALLGGADDRLGTDAVSWAVVRLAANLGSRSLRLGAQKAVAATLRIRFNAKDRTATGFQKVLGMSWGDVWASATGCPAFGEAVEAAVDREVRRIRPDAVIRVVGAVRAGVWDSPVGQTLKRRPMQLRVVPIDTVEVDSAFLTPAVALEWATVRIERDARRLAEVLDDCKTLEDFLDALGARTMPAAGKTAAVQVWTVYSKAREEAAYSAATASGAFDWNKAPCVGKLLDGTLRYELKNDLRFGLAVVLEEAARRRGPGAHARTLFPIESLGAVCTEAGPLRRREFTATLKNMARKTPGPLSRCTVIAARTMRGEPGLKCPAASCDACHRAAGIPATTPPEDVTPGMVASFTAR